MTNAIDWAEPATLIDLAGKAPLISTVQKCVRHFAALKTDHQAEARILLTRPVHREGQKTGVWLLNPDEIAALVPQLRAMQN